MGWERRRERVKRRKIRTDNKGGRLEITSSGNCEMAQLFPGKVAYEFNLVLLHGCPRFS